MKKRLRRKLAEYDCALVVVLLGSAERARAGDQVHAGGGRRAERLGQGARPVIAGHLARDDESTVSAFVIAHIDAVTGLEQVEVEEDRLLDAVVIEVAR